MGEKINLHEDHRKRVKEKFAENGFSGSTPDHEIIEMILFYAIPRKDTNELAHLLYNKFGSLSGVLSAPISELIKVDGISYHTAILFKLFFEVAKTYKNQSIGKQILHCPEDAGNILLEHYKFYGKEEIFSMLSLNNLGEVLSFDIVEYGDIASVGVSNRKILETLIKTKATSVIIAHNHPGGIALPSDADIQITASIKSALNTIGVHLSDHVIIADNDYVSLLQSEKFKYLFE